MGHYFNCTEIFILRDITFNCGIVFYTCISLDHDPVVGFLGGLSFCCCKFYPVPSIPRCMLFIFLHLRSQNLSPHGIL